MVKAVEGGFHYLYVMVKAVEGGLHYVYVMVNAVEGAYNMFMSWLML